MFYVSTTKKKNRKSKSKEAIGHKSRNLKKKKKAYQRKTYKIQDGYLKILIKLDKPLAKLINKRHKLPITGIKRENHH